MATIYYRYMLYGLLWGVSCTAMAQRNKANVPVVSCGVPELTDAQRQFLDREAAFSLQVKRASGVKANTLTYVPLKPHIFRQSNGNGSLSVAKLNQVIALANRYFLVNNTGIQFYFCGTSPDYVDNDAWYASYARTDEGAIANTRDVNNALNLYLINNTADGYAGYAYYPANVLYSTRTFILATQSEDNLGNKVIPHELGHLFNLVHTFGDTNGGTSELVTRGNGANCNLAGDYLCDTPADPYGKPGAVTDSHNGCITYTGTATDAQGAAYAPSMSNLMSYYFSCSNDFTPGQYARMESGLAFRQTHTAYTLNCPPTNVSRPTNLVATNAPAAVVLTWTDNASNEMGYFIERSTSATDGFVPIGGVAANVTTFADARPPGSTMVYYRIRPSNGAQLGVSTVVGVQTGACRPTYSSGCSEGDGLSQFAFNSVALSQNTNCPSGTTGYSQYTAVTPTVTPGRSYTFAGGLSSASYPQGVSIWADLNRNGSFDDVGERLYQSASLVTGSFSGSLTLPVNVTAGALPLRVSVAYNIKPMDPCGKYDYGETEDYILHVVVPQPCSSPLSQSVTDVSTATAEIRWSVSAGVTYELRCRPVGSVNWTTTQPIAAPPCVLTALTPNTVYEYQIRALCSNGQSSTFSEATSFTTLTCPVPYNLFVDNVKGQSVRLNWSSAKQALLYYVRYRVKNTATWTQPVSTTATSYVLNGIMPGTSYDWEVSTTCSGPASSNYATGQAFATAIPCTTMVTTKQGAWDDPTVWSCNRVPTTGDAVVIQHVITLPADKVANVLSVAYAANARINLGARSRLRVGFTP